MIRHVTLITLSLSALALSGCTGLGLAAGAAAVTGIAVAQEGGIRRAVSDTSIKARINDAWLKYDLGAFVKLSTTVNQGRVLITGVVQNPEHRVEAVRLAWQVPGVEQVINEIRVADSTGITGFAKDAWITTRLRTSIALDREVQSINYSIDTVQGIVYLMGVAQNQVELNRVIEKGRTIAGVKQVVSYVKLPGQTLASGREVNQPNRMESSVQQFPADGSNIQWQGAQQIVTPQPTLNQTSNQFTTQTSSQIVRPVMNEVVTQEVIVNETIITDAVTNGVVNTMPNTVSGTVIQTVPTVGQALDVPTRLVPENAPRIQDQYQ